MFLFLYTFSLFCLLLEVRIYCLYFFIFLLTGGIFEFWFLLFLRFLFVRFKMLDGVFKWFLITEIHLHLFISLLIINPKRIFFWNRLNFFFICPNSHIWRKLAQLDLILIDNYQPFKPYPPLVILYFLWVFLVWFLWA